eukprot:1533599-Amphidinium_carterae.1
MKGSTNNIKVNVMQASSKVEVSLRSSCLSSRPTSKSNQSTRSQLGNISLSLPEFACERNTVVAGNIGTIVCPSIWKVQPQSPSNSAATRGAMCHIVQGNKDSQEQWQRGEDKHSNFCCVSLEAKL